MALRIKIKDDTSKVIASLLVRALEDSRQGDMSIAHSLGLSIETMRNLESMKADQINSIASAYMHNLNGLEIYKLDIDRVTQIIETEMNEHEIFEMSNEFLRRGACKITMLDLFGMRSVEVANRRRILKINAPLGRLKVASEEQERSIYDAWLAGVKIAEFRSRLLYVARVTTLPLGLIYRQVQEIEVVSNNRTKLRKNQKWAKEAI